ncbi:hypothetical protein KC968_01550 [Candidatus Saccharibacteria bacterium]|nr:hypothetical protein [Candidatus Saccharibacteria bacterium]
MKNFEQLPSNGNMLRRTTAALALCISAVAVTACGGNAEPERDNGVIETVDQTSVSHTYFEDGSRLTEYKDADNYAPILSHCDGRDLVDQTNFAKAPYKGAGNAIDRAVDHPACADGRLTPDDFIIPG